MKSIVCVFIYGLVINCVSGQSSVTAQINATNPPAIALSPLRFLASDELMGRSSTRPEINIAARYFSLHTAKRSILFITFTGEEMGLLGSIYFAEHPPLPLKQLVYDLNIDNASYNDTTAITLVGLGRTSADEDIRKACAEYGLSILPDPLSGRLFYGSDNLPLAQKGIPAPTFSLGMKSFDQSILNRYHQLSDEVENLNLIYTMKFIHSFILSAKNIADNPSKPKWIKGDAFERKRD